MFLLTLVKGEWRVTVCTESGMEIASDEGDIEYGLRVRSRNSDGDSTDDRRSVSTGISDRIRLRLFSGS